jgi:two-component system chemotaxis response regulator CheB
MERSPLPIVIVSVASESGELVLNALDAGAVDVVQKPTALASEQLLTISEELVAKVKAAAGARARKPVPAGPEAPLSRASSSRGSAIEIVVIGISTGGPQALRVLIPQLPSDLPVPVAVVLHMPIGFTQLYAEKLNDISSLEVSEAVDDMEVRPGMVLIAPAGRHLVMRRSPAGKVMTRLDVKPLDTPHRPSVDVLFQSAAEVYGGGVLGVVMTGMGADGRDGAAWIKAKGGKVLTETEESCVVYGMPRSIIEAGLSDRAVDLNRMAGAILEHL